MAMSFMRGLSYAPSMLEPRIIAILLNLRETVSTIHADRHHNMIENVVTLQIKMHHAFSL